MRVKLINKSHYPALTMPHLVLLDIRANLSEPIVLEPFERCLVPTGLFPRSPKAKRDPPS